MESDGIGYGWQPVGLGSKLWWWNGVHSCGQGESGRFLQCKSFAYITLELVNKVHRLAGGMGSYGVSEVGTWAGKWAGWGWMGQVLHWGLLQDLEAVGVAGLWVRRLVSTISWQRLGGLRKVTEGGLVRRSWVDGSFSNLFCHFTYIIAHSPSLPSLYLHHSSFSNPSVASPMSQLILQPFFCFFVTGSSLASPGELPVDLSLSDQCCCLEVTSLWDWIEWTLYLGSPFCDWACLRSYIGSQLHLQLTGNEPWTLCMECIPIHWLMEKMSRSRWINNE